MYKIWVDVERAGFMGSNIHENQQEHAEWRLYNNDVFKSVRDSQRAAVYIHVVLNDSPLITLRLIGFFPRNLWTGLGHMRLCWLMHSDRPHRVILQVFWTFLMVFNTAVRALSGGEV